MALRKLINMRKMDILSKIVFIAMLCCRCSSEADKTLSTNIPSRKQHPVCKESEIEHSDVINNRGLGHLSPKNYTFLGNVPKMSDCMALCCSTKHCNIAYLKNSSCFGVTCLDADKCSVKNNTIETGTKLALMIRNEMNRRVYVTAYLVVVVCAFGAALAGTVWAVFVFYKRYSSTRTDDSEEEGELLKQPKVY